MRPSSWPRLVATALFVMAASTVMAADAPSKPLNVLFLGDKGHHRPADRAAQLIPVMANRGVNITYTEAMSDLNPTTLAKYDVLFIYANTEKIEPDQEKALVDYVENGGGFAPIHCASYCFLNSPKYISPRRRPVQEPRHRRLRHQDRRRRQPDHEGNHPRSERGTRLTFTASTTRRTATCSRSARKGTARSPGPGPGHKARAASSTPLTVTITGPGVIPASTT